jgi:predicted metal-binding protein
MRVEICTGCHANTGGEESFGDWLKLLEERFGIGYFGGVGRGLEVEFVACLSHCNQGFSLAVEGEVLVLADPADFDALLARLNTPTP